MNDWKEDLKRQWKAARGNKRDEKPTKVDSEPPKSRLNGNPSASKKPDDSKGAPRPSPSVARDGLIGTKHRNAQIVQKPVQRSTTSSAAGKSSRPQSMTSRENATPAVFRPCIEAGRDLFMPDWCSAGKSLQHPDYRGRKTVPMTIRIGLDFGTAFTKVAIRAGFDLLPVDWSAVTGDNSPTGRYVLPGFVHRTPDGEYCWRLGLDGTEIIGNLKLPVIDMTGSDACPAATIAFLALVIRYARAYLYRHRELGPMLAACPLRWELNIGCPTKPHEEPKIVERFRQIARIAWRMAGAAKLRESDIQSAYQERELPKGLEAEPGVIPEFVAQIAGYLNSPQVGEGLHALIDIGAATLDVAAFNVVKNRNRPNDPNWRLPIFYPAVRCLGTHFLNENRHRRLQLPLDWDDTSLPLRIDEFAARHAKPMKEVEKADRSFLEQVVQCIYNVFRSTRFSGKGLGPNHSAWRQELPFFLTGGGSEVDLYVQAIKDAESRLKKDIVDSIGPVEGGRFRMLEFPLAEPGQRRLSVAMGLTEDDIAKIIPFQ